MFASVTGRIIYLSTDRFDIMFAVRALASDLASPTKLSMLRLKRVVKYLLGTAGLCWAYKFQSQGDGVR